MLRRVVKAVRGSSQQDGRVFSELAGGLLLPVNCLLDEARGLGPVEETLTRGVLTLSTNP